MGKVARGKNQNKPPTPHTHVAGSTSIVRVCSRHDMSIDHEIRFCRNIESFFYKIYKRAGVIYVLCWVEFSKIGKRNVTFIRKMRVSTM